MVYCFPFTWAIWAGASKGKAAERTPAPELASAAEEDIAGDRRRMSDGEERNEGRAVMRREELEGVRNSTGREFGERPAISVAFCGGEVGLPGEEGEGMLRVARLAGSRSQVFWVVSSEAASGGDSLLKVLF